MEGNRIGELPMNRRAPEVRVKKNYGTSGGCAVGTARNCTISSEVISQTKKESERGVK